MQQTVTQGEIWLKTDVLSPTYWIEYLDLV